MCCRHATKIIKRDSKAETISNLKVHSKSLQDYVSSAKKIYFINYEVGTGCPKLGHTYIDAALCVAAVFGEFGSNFSLKLDTQRLSRDGLPLQSC